MNLTEFLLFLTYGFSMISMGIFALVQKNSRIVDFPLIRSLKYLGFFGIIHGTSEWVTMIIKLQLCHPDQIMAVYYTNLFLKALSFIFLMRFGLDLRPERSSPNLVVRIPWMGFLAYMIGFGLLMFKYGAGYHLANTTYNTVTIRYLMAIPACTVVAAHLFHNARLIEKTKSVEVSRRYKRLALIFVAYGFVEGVLVAKAPFFPANIINTEIFPEYFSLLTLSFKALVGFIVAYLMFRVIDTFSWEQEDRLQQLEKIRIASEERRKLGLEIHDSIIQQLYAIGLKIDYLSKHRDKSERDILEEVKGDVRSTIHKTREIISVDSGDEIELDKLKSSLEQMVHRYNQSQNTKIRLKWKISPYTAGSILPETTTQIYYIVQEAITNVIKHSRAEYAEVVLQGENEFIYVTITDNGRGISRRDIDPKEHFGIRSMQERTQRVNGFFKIEKLLKGTRVEVKIPWEESWL